MNEIKPKRMLVVLAHPDDESFAAGGTLARYADQDVQIVLLCATRGEAGIPGLSQSEAGRLREHELRQAAGHLGIEVYFLDYLDGELTDANSDTLFQTIVAWIDLVQPQVILTFGPDGVSGHPDHIAVSHIVTHAYDQFYNQGLLLYIRPSDATILGCGVSSSTSHDGLPMVSVDISDYKHHKVRAIQSHVSQNPELPDKLEEAVEHIPCHELYTIARDAQAEHNDPVWFEPNRHAVPETPNQESKINFEFLTKERI